MSDLEEGRALTAPLLCIREWYIVPYCSKATRQETHRLPRLMSKLAMKHRPIKAINTFPNHYRRANEICRDFGNFPKAQRNADRRSEARNPFLAAVVKILKETIDLGIAIGRLGDPVSIFVCFALTTGI